MIRCVYVFLLTTMFYVSSSAQTDYQMSLDNGELINSNTFEFNVYIKSVDSTFQLTSYQCSFSFDVNDGGSLSFSYIPGTSELSNPPSIGVGLKTADGTQKLTFASMPGSDYVSSTPVRVGSFRLEDTNPLDGVNPNVRWNFEGKVTTILTGSNFVNITNPSNHIKNFGDLVNYQVAGVTATGTTDPNTAPEKTIDGLGYYDGDPNSRWAAQSMPQHIIFDLGSEKSVSMTKFSFFNFQEGRVYQYTVSVSNDQVNWNEVVVNASSASEEWTVNQFTSQAARYVRLQFLSSTNNPNNWANLWEAQILGDDEALPVELSSYTGSVDNNNIVLEWLTSSELNNKGFEIEREFDKGKFEVIGFISGHGTTNEKNSYAFVDKELLPGKYSYRLKQVDYSGKFEYSNILDFEVTNLADTYQLYQNYPNPFNPTTKIEFDMKEKAFITLTIYNIVGEKVRELVNDELSKGKHALDFDAVGLPSGVYVYSLNVKDEFFQTRKMTLIK